MGGGRATTSHLLPFRPPRGIVELPLSLKVGVLFPLGLVQPIDYLVYSLLDVSFLHFLAFVKAHLGHVGNNTSGDDEAIARAYATQGMRFA